MEHLNQHSIINDKLADILVFRHVTAPVGLQCACLTAEEIAFCGFLALPATVVYVGFFVILSIRPCVCDMVCILW